MTLNKADIEISISKLAESFQKLHSSILHQNRREMCEKLTNFEQQLKYRRYVENMNLCETNFLNLQKVVENLGAKMDIYLQEIFNDLKNAFFQVEKCCRDVRHCYLATCQHVQKLTEDGQAELESLNENFAHRTSINLLLNLAEEILNIVEENLKIKNEIFDNFDLKITDLLELKKIWLFKFIVLQKFDFLLSNCGLS